MAEHESGCDTRCSFCLERFPKDLNKRIVELEIRRKITTINTTLFLRSAKLFKRVLESQGDSMLLWHQKKKQKNLWQKTNKKKNNNVVNTSFIANVIETFSKFTSRYFQYHWGYWHEGVYLVSCQDMKIFLIWGSSLSSICIILPNLSSGVWSSD